MVLELGTLLCVMFTLFGSFEAVLEIPGTRRNKIAAGSITLDSLNVKLFVCAVGSLGRAKVALVTDEAKTNLKFLKGRNLRPTSESFDPSLDWVISLIEKHSDLFIYDNWSPPVHGKRSCTKG